MLECERLVQRGDYKAAIAALQKLPADLYAYGPSVEGLSLACLGRSGQWASVIQAVEPRKDKELWALFYLVLAYDHLGKITNGNDLVTTLHERAESQLEVHPSDRDANFYLAFSDRISGRTEKAYEILHKLFPETIVPLDYTMTLMGADSGLDVFKSDPEFQTLAASFEKRNQVIRDRIDEIERQFTH